MLIRVTMTIIALAAGAAGTVWGQQFWAAYQLKQAALKNIRVSPLGEMPSYNSSSAPTSTRVQRTTYPPPAPPQQYLRVYNASSYDVKNLAVECSYLSQSGALIVAKSDTLLKVFPIGRAIDATWVVPTAPEATQTRCVATGFELIGVGVPPPAEPIAPRTSSAPLKDDWRAAPIKDNWEGRSRR